MFFTITCGATYLQSSTNLKTDWSPLNKFNLIDSKELNKLFLRKSFGDPYYPKGFPLKLFLRSNSFNSFELIKLNLFFYDNVWGWRWGCEAQKLKLKPHLFLFAPLCFMFCFLGFWLSAFWASPTNQTLNLKPHQPNPQQQTPNPEP